jgi:hypothetical protein
MIHDSQIADYGDIYDGMVGNVPLTQLLVT